MTTMSDDDVRRDVVRRIRSEGVEAAYRACLAVCRDEKAPAPARATAATALLRAGGLFDKADVQAAAKELHEMTSEELAEAAERLRRQMHPATADGEGGEAGVFD